MIFNPLNNPYGKTKGNECGGGQPAVASDTGRHCACRYVAAGQLLGQTSAQMPGDTKASSLEKKNKTKQNDAH